MTNNKKYYTEIKAGFSLIGVLLFLVFCDMYQPNAEIATLELSTIFMSIIWVFVTELLIVGILLLLVGILAVIVSAADD